MNVLENLEEEANFIQDLDLVFLGSTPDAYRAYTAALRKEHLHLDDKEYNATRLKALHTLLNVLPSIYSTSKFKDMFEEAAKSNVSKEIEELKNQKC